MLLIIDLQEGFASERTSHIIPCIGELLCEAKRRKLPIVCTRFVNSRGSRYVRWLGWYRLMTRPEIDLMPWLVGDCTLIVTKTQYSAFTREFDEFILLKGINRIYIAGLESDACVLKTALDAFDRDIEPIVVHDACASRRGRAAHEVAKRVLARLIGPDRLRTTAEVLAAGLI